MAEFACTIFSCPLEYVSCKEKEGAGMVRRIYAARLVSCAGKLAAFGLRGALLRRLIRPHKLVSVLLVSLLIAGCSLERQERLIAYGVGTDLYTPDIAQASANLSAYLGYLCVQAGVGVAVGPRGAPHCLEGSMGAIEWTLVVATGWNDIDRRCDSYLAWLDNQRRTRLFANQQFGHLRTLTSGIFGAVDVASEAIAIVGVALGFAQDTYNSYHDRLLLDIEGSTIETLVTERRISFREEFAGTAFRFKPDVVKVLRDYLRICTPYAIRMDINTYSRASVTGVIPVGEREPERLRQALLSTSPIRSATAPIPAPPEPPRIVSPTRFNSYEESLLPSQIEEFQRAVCVPTTGELGPLGSATRLAIQRALGASDQILTDRKGVLLRRKLREGVTC